MKKIFLSLLLVSSVYNLLAQKTINDPNAEKRSVSGFHGIEVATGIKLLLSQGNTEDVAVSAATTEFRDKIVTEVKDGILRIHYETKYGAWNRRKEEKDLRAYVSFKTLDKLEANTGARIQIDGAINVPTLDLKANTGGTVDGEMNTMSLNVYQNTGAKVTLTGKADKLEVGGDTGSKFFGEGLKTTNCSAEASTGARIFISVDKELNAKANTGGNIKYKGEVTIKEVKTNTGGSVSKI